MRDSLCLVMAWSDPHVSQDPEVARAASHHRPEQIVIAGYQLVGRGKLAGRKTEVRNRLVHLHVEVCTEELLRRHSYVINNQLGASKPFGGKIPRTGIFFYPCWLFMAVGRL